MHFPFIALSTAGMLAGLLTLPVEGEETNPPHTDFRKEIRSSYVFIPHPETATEPVPVWSTRLTAIATDDLTTDDGPDLVKLAPFKVNGAYRDDGLHEKIVQQMKDAQRREVLNKLGIGVHTVGHGKVVFGATTVFWIPISVGMSW